MRIWYLNHFASTPDQPTTGAYFLMEGLARSGHEVRVFASGFNYYLRNSARMQGKLLTHRERVGKVDFQWIRSTPTQGRFATRLLNMLSYSLLAVMVGCVVRPRPDVVMAACPHPFAALAAWLLAKCHGAKFVYEIRDIWPESLTEGKHVSKNNLFAQLLMKLQLFLYRRADLLISVIPKFDEYLKSVGLTSFRFQWVPNGITIDRAQVPPASGGPQSQSEPFKVMYLGGHSKYHALDTLLDAALLLKDTSQIRLIMIGEGTEKPRLVEKAKSLGLTNIEFRPAIPRREVLGVSKEADCFISHNRTIPVLRFGGSLNKLCDFMLAARPIIYASGTGNDPVSEHNCGVTIEPVDPRALADAILHIYRLPASTRREMGERAQAYALEHFDAERIAKKLDGTLQEIIRAK